MSVQTRVDEDGRHRVVFDDMNPRIYQEEWACRRCGAWVPVDDVLWVNPNGSLSTDTGDPYCSSGCAPEEVER